MKDQVNELVDAKLHPLLCKLFQYDEALTKPELIEEAYHVLKHVQGIVAIYNRIEQYEYFSFLLKRFSLKNAKISLTSDDERILREGLLLLWKNELSQHELMKHQSTLRKQEQVQYKVVIVDTDAMFVEWLESHVGDKGYELIHVQPEELLHTLLKENVFAVVVNMNPYEQIFPIVQVVKRHKVLSSIPMLGYAYAISEQMQVELVKIDIPLILKKPFSASLFLNQLEHIKNRRAHINRDTAFLPSIQKVEMLHLLQKEWVRFERFHSYFCLIQIKLEGYHTLFEAYGFDKVYHVLNKLYQLVHHSLRIYDEVRGWGQDSMLILLPAARLEGAKVVAKRIKALADKLCEEEEFPQQFLIGVSESEHSYRESEGMVQRLETETKLQALPSSVYALPPLVKPEVGDEEGLKKLLIIDEDLTTVTLIQNHLKTEEWQIEVCTYGVNAIDHVIRFQPDFIICETKLKDLDGITFCSIIRQFPSCKETVFIFLSKQSLNHFIVNGLRAGADDYVTKPFSVVELEERMRRTWARHSSVVKEKE